MNYCGGAPTLAKNLNIPLEEAEDIIDKYEKGFFECIQWKQKSMRDCIERQNGVCFTLFGRPRQFKSRLTTAADLADMGMRAGAGYNPYTSKSTGMIKAVERRIISHHIQSTCGDICRWDLIRLYRKYFKHRNPDIDFMTTVHDEINFTATKEKAVDFAREIDDIMTITDFREDLPIKTSIDVGYTLGVLFPFEWEDETRQRLVPKRA
jgi:DNA polymerase I-like protein with 3'-5' exonuclease and polymerase domains